MANKQVIPDEEIAAIVGYLNCELSIGEAARMARTVPSRFGNWLIATLSILIADGRIKLEVTQSNGEANDE